MTTVYLLMHSYEYEYKGATFDEIKTLGIYSSREKAQAAVNYFKTIEGFKDFSENCFFIDPYVLDQRYWEEGFV